MNEEFEIELSDGEEVVEATIEELSNGREPGYE